MDFFLIFRYILIFTFVIGFISYLYFSHTGSFPIWGRKKKLLLFLQENRALRPNHKNKIADALTNLEKLYKKNGSVDCNALLQDLYTIKDQDETVKSVTDTLIQKFSEKNKYIGISQNVAREFIQLEKALVNGSATDSEKAMRRIVAELSESQQKIKRNSFVSIFFGILGAIVTLVEFINLILEALGV